MTLGNSLPKLSIIHLPVLAEEPPPHYLRLVTTFPVLHGFTQYTCVKLIRLNSHILLLEKGQPARSSINYNPGNTAEGSTTYWYSHSGLTCN